MNISWNDVLRRTDIVGGDIESHEDAVYRGPISKVEVHGEMFCVYTEWTARSENPGKWEKFESPGPLSVNMSLIKPSDIGNGRIAWQAPLMGPVVIFPKGGNKLDPRKVKGLDQKKISA